MALTPPIMNAGNMACRSAPAREHARRATRSPRPCSPSRPCRPPCTRPSTTPGPMACILVLMLAITTSSSSVHRRMASSSCRVLPAVLQSGRRWRPARSRGNAGARTPADCAARDEFACGWGSRSLRRVHATGLGHRAFEDPLGQRRVAQRLAGVDVFLDHLGHVQPAGFLPQLERALLHAKAPAHAEVHVAGVVGNRGQVHGGVVEAVAQNGPQELALRAFGVAQQLQALGGRLFEHAAIHLVGLLAAGHVLFAFQVKAQNVAPDLLEETCLGFLAQVAHLQQRLEHRRGGKAGVERIALLRPGCPAAS